MAFALKCLSVVPNDFQDNVVGVNGSIFFSFVCRMSNDTNECPKMLLNVD